MLHLLIFSVPNKLIGALLRRRCEIRIYLWLALSVRAREERG
jgi:hypothetical protein